MPWRADSRTQRVTRVRALITGIGGFVGRHLLEHLLQSGDEVSGISRPADSVGIHPSVRVYQGDLRDRAAVQSVLEQARPDGIYHLAAQASVGQSVADPWPTLSNNLQSQMNLFEAVLAVGIRPRILAIGSADEYGRVRPEEVPTHENVPLRPTTAYGVSKVGQDVMAFQYFAQHGLPIVRVRPFNHTGAGQDDRFVVPSFARQIAEIEAGTREPVIRVGNLDVSRDFSDVRDVVRGYRLALVQGADGEVYNIGGGESTRIADILDALVRLSRVPVTVVPDPARFRPADVPRQAADCSKLRALTGWRAEIPLETTLRDTLEYWRSRVSGSAVATPGQAGEQPPGIGLHAGRPPV